MNLAERLRQDGFASVDPVLFFALDGPWWEFSNFSDHAVELPDPWTSRRRRYPFGEHRYQAVKAADQAGTTGSAAPAARVQRRTADAASPSARTGATYTALSAGT